MSLVQSGAAGVVQKSHWFTINGEFNLFFKYFSSNFKSNIDSSYQQCHEPGLKEKGLHNFNILFNFPIKTFCELTENGASAVCVKLVFKSREMCDWNRKLLIMFLV